MEPHKVLLYLVGIAVLSSCLSHDLEDVSDDETYSDLIGQKYKSVVELLIHGVTEKNYGKEIDYFVVTEQPGIDGPEVLSRHLLEAGSLIQIEKVMACTNCLSSRLYFQIEFLSEEGYSDHPITIRSTQMDIAKYKDGKAEINPELFVTAAD